MDEGSPAISFILFVLCIAIEIILYGFGSAIQQLNAGQIRDAAMEGDKRAKKIENIMDRPMYYINMMQMFTIIIQLSMGTFFLRMFEQFFEKIPNISKIPYFGVSITVILASIVLFVCIYVIGVLMPKKIGNKYPKQWVYAFIGPISILLICFKPVTAVFDLIANLLVRLFGINPHDGEADVTEEEIISMVNEGQEQGVLLESEAQMITNIFEFTDKDAKDIMTHRSNIVGIEATMTLREAVDFMLEEKNSRYPVYEENIDHIIGIIHLKDACRMLDGGKNETKPIKSIKNLIREAKFIPETRNIDTLFRSMQSLKTHMVIVIDEYGQTTGLIAMEDILEEIVGNILDEYDEDDSFIQEKGDDCYEIDGLTPLAELSEKLDIDFSKEEFETLNGLLISHLEHIPQEDDLFDIDYGGYNFKVLSVQNKVIQTVLVTKCQPKGQDDDEKEKIKNKIETKEN